MIIVSVHVHFFCLSVASVYVSQVTSGYVRFHQVTSVYVGGTGRGARQFHEFVQNSEDFSSFCAKYIEV